MFPYSHSRSKHRDKSPVLKKVGKLDDNDIRLMSCTVIKDRLNLPMEDDKLYDKSDTFRQTPSRTRLSRRQKYKKQKEAECACKAVKSICAKTKMRRRNTLDTILFTEMCDKADQDVEMEEQKETIKDGNYKNKKKMKQLKNSDRDYKQVDENNSEKLSSSITNIKIETRNRFRCLHSKPVDVESKNTSSSFSTSSSLSISDDSTNTELCSTPVKRKEREAFHNDFHNLIKLASGDKENICQMSREETRWQSELKDLIWLELQAYHEGRSVVAQDEWLCKQREAIGPLLKEIMEYRFDPNSIESQSPSTPSFNEPFLDVLSSNLGRDSCSGCYSMLCRACAKAQCASLKQVEMLLSRLDRAESLYPSSQSFAANYPLYKSQEFNNRIKSMCLWYNMTRYHRLQLLILGKLLMLMKKKKANEDSDSGVSFGSKLESLDAVMFKKPQVRFELCQSEENASPGDSCNSNVSSSSSVSVFSSGKSIPSSPDSSFIIDNDAIERMNFPVWDFSITDFDREAYRKYIENVLKTRGLKKSLYFFERLHMTILSKASMTLEKPNEHFKFNEKEEYESEQESIRYGVWSQEAADLNLPSYRAAFVFLSRVPLDIIHEFLRMRLEQKPEQPTLLSIRQMMYELKEFVFRMACLHRDKFIEHTRAAEGVNNGDGKDEGDSQSMFDEDVKKFEETLKEMFELYLEYLEQWVDMIQHTIFCKNRIMDEWRFVKNVANNIRGGHEIAGERFCKIALIAIKQVDEFLVERPKELTEMKDNAELVDDDESSTRYHLMYLGREWQGMFVDARERVIKTIMFYRCLKKDMENWIDYDKTLKKSIDKVKESLLQLRNRMLKIIEDFERKIDKVDEPINESDLVSLRTRVREILHQGYKMGFEYYREMYKLLSAEERVTLVQSLIDFSFQWMNFVQRRCERGRGVRPRWACQGLEFLNTICDPSITVNISDAKFDELKVAVDKCVQHVIGTPSTTNLPVNRIRTPPTQKMRDNTKNNSSEVDKKNPSITGSFLSLYSDTSETRNERIFDAVLKLDQQIDSRLRSRYLIGQVTDKKAVIDRCHFVRRVNFTWQRGIKIGQGRFGKVYTVVNNQTGELLAMKEVQLQPGDHRAVKSVAEELQIFEGIQHKHLVRYYGVEIHREEMLIFMEFCAEGTLQSLAAGSENGLPEQLVRKYTRQLLLAVKVMHSHGIVHRDIKPANIFLTDLGNCLKLGDFGCAVKINAHTTMPGELRGFVGTQAYMAPEVFMKNESIGHGRAVDIWSVGCCVIEMASGKMPWSEFDSYYQIMFKVGMGESPQPPKHLSPEGVDFVKKCLQHDAKRRPTGDVLLSHTFTTVYDDANVDLTT